MDLSNRVALITGAAQGIGKSIALVLAQYGAIIVATDIGKSGLEQTLKEIEAVGGHGLTLKMDVTDHKQVENGVRTVIGEYGKIDILVNCAGIINEPALVVDLSEKLWDKVMDVNLKGVFLCSQAVAREMSKRQQGKIINIASIASKTGTMTYAPYCASKAAVAMLTQVLALELAPKNICVNAVCPGHTETELMQKVFRESHITGGRTPEQRKEALIHAIPLKRLAKPDEIGESVAFLASDKADYITGTTLVVAGGRELH